jgi:hypothetical protein
MTGREREMLLLRSPWERPAPALAMSVLYGALIAVLLTLMNYYVIVFRWSNVLGFLFAGVGVALLTWGSNRLWHSTVSKMMRDPFSLVAYATRAPFWYIAGGMGYVLGMYVAGNRGMLEMYTVPARQLFRFGGILGCVVQVPAQVLSSYRFSTTGRKVQKNNHNH